MIRYIKFKIQTKKFDLQRSRYNKPDITCSNIVNTPKVLNLVSINKTL